MNHQQEHGHAGPAAAPTPAAPGSTIEPGRASHTASLHRPEHPIASGLVQRQARGASPAAPDIHEVAERGIAGPGSALPHLETIQRLFGPEHDVSGVRSHVGGAAADAAGEIGAIAYATGNQVAFAEAPSLHTAAHEAAHVVQQRAGVHLKSGVGEVGDTYERHADAVADAVVRGDSASGLLSAFTGGRAGDDRAVQRAAHGSHSAHGHRAAATAGPSADDRNTGEARDLHTRLVNISDVGSGCEIHFGGGAQRGVFAGMPGHILAGAHLLVEFQVETVHDAYSTARLAMPADALRGCHDVVVNPTSKPGPARDIQAKITAHEPTSGGALLVINAGAPAGVRAGMTAYMHEHPGAPPYKRFVIDSVHGDVCHALVPLPTHNFANHYPHVVINPAGGASHDAPTVAHAAKGAAPAEPAGATSARHAPRPHRGHP